MLFETLNWGGALLVFEKVRGADARFQDIFTSLYTDYKIEQGYSSDEIAQRAKSLKGRLEPFSTQGNLEMFERAGFKDVIAVFKCLCFEGFLAIK
jgi:tRNA (cmo5U34)-methyltransferase